MHKNVLLTSAGRRGLLVQQFQQELGSLFPKSSLFAADLLPEASSACLLADRSFRLPRIGNSDYIDQLLSLCIKQQIGLVVPTIDTELTLLADNRKYFLDHNIHIAVSDPQFVRRCRDKRLTAELFAQYGIESPQPMNPTRDATYPLFAKPYDGSSSNDLCVVESFADVTPALLNNPKIIYSEYLSPCHHDEYTVDMYFDRHSKLKCLVPRLRIETRAGEVSKGRTSKFLAMNLLCKNFQHVAGARGCLTVQFFARRSDGYIYGIEINPRFGGGFPLSYDAGANFPKWLIGEYLNQEGIEFCDDWEDGLTMLRYDHHVLVRSAS